MTGQLVTAKAAAKYLGVSRTTLTVWTRAGRVPHVIDPDTEWCRYSLPALDRWLADNCPMQERAS